MFGYNPKEYLGQNRPVNKITQTCHGYIIVLLTEISDCIRQTSEAYSPCGFANSDPPILCRSGLGSLPNCYLQLPTFSVGFKSGLWQGSLRNIQGTVLKPPGWVMRSLAKFLFGFQVLFCFRDVFGSFNCSFKCKHPFCILKDVAVLQ